MSVIVVDEPLSAVDLDLDRLDLRCLCLVNCCNFIYDFSGQMSRFIIILEASLSSSFLEEGLSFD